MKQGDQRLKRFGCQGSLREAPVVGEPVGGGEPGHVEQYYPGLTSGIPGNIKHALAVVWGLQ